MYHALGMVMLGIYISRHTTGGGREDRERLRSRSSAMFTWWKSNALKEPIFVIKQDFLETPYSYKQPSSLYPTDMFPGIHYMKLTQITHITKKIEKMRAEADVKISQRRIAKGLEYDRTTASDWLSGLQDSIQQANTVPITAGQAVSTNSDEIRSNNPRDTPQIE